MTWLAMLCHSCLTNLIHMYKKYNWVITYYIIGCHLVARTNCFYFFH